MVDSADAIARAVGEIEAHARATESEPNEFSGRNLEASAGRRRCAPSRNIGLRPSVYLSFKAARKKPGELLDRADTNRSEERDTLSRDLGWPGQGQGDAGGQGAPAPEAKDGKAAKGGNPTGAKAEADAEAEAEAKAAAEARKKVFPTVGSPVAAASVPTPSRRAVPQRGAAGPGPAEPPTASSSANADDDVVMGAREAAATFLTQPSDPPLRVLDGLARPRSPCPTRRRPSSDGSIKLEYECEARTSPLDSAAVTYGSTSALLNGAQVTVKKGDWVRLGTTSDSYYEVDKAYGDGSYQANAFSDGARRVHGRAHGRRGRRLLQRPSSDDDVSSACATSRVRSTDVINVDASAAAWSSTLRSVATIESASDYLVVTAAKPLPGNGSYVGLYVDVEFLAQHGDLKPMDGSLADGDFSLTTYWPNERVAKPSPFNATGLRWNSPSDTMDAVMERVGAGDGVSLAFGLVDVSRSAYTPSTDTRWSGGYAWTVTFLSAIGNVPQMKVESNVTVSYAAKTKSLASSYWGHSAVTLEVEDESSGSEDTYQGDANSYTFGLDSTGAADGGQVSGSYGLTFGDTTSADTAFSVANATSYKAISDAAFKAQFQAALRGRASPPTSRSSSPNRAAAYTYTITYRSAEVGGDVALLGTDATQLSGTGASVSVSVEEEGAQIYGSFQLRFSGYTTGVVSYDASAEDVEAQLNALQSISPSKTSLMDYLAPGEVFRLGGVDGGIYSSHAGKVDGSEMLGSLLDYSENAPVVGTPQAPSAKSGSTQHTTCLDLRVRRGRRDGASGHGYEYLFEMTGTNNNRDAYGYGGWTSSILGSNAPKIEVVAVGSEFGCQDALGPEEKLDVTATTKHNSTRVELSANAALYVAPGDRIRIGDSSDPFMICTVAEIATFLSKYWIELTLPFDCGNSTHGSGPIYGLTNGCGGGKTIHVVNEATGECLDWSHYGGRARDARVSTVVPGGSLEVQTLTLATDSAQARAGRRVLRVLHQPRTMVTASSTGLGNDPEGACFDWDTPAATLEERIVAALNLTYVNSTIDEAQVKYTGSLVGGDMPTVFAIDNSMSLPEIYFDGLVGVSQPPTIYANKSNCSARPFSDNNDEYVVADVVSAGAGAGTVRFTDALLPLGSRDDATAAGQFLGPNGTALSIYKLSGSALSVAFDEALGDQPAMLADGAYLADGVAATVVDDVASDYGYDFEIFFDGIGMQTACTDLFATSVYGVLTPFAWTDGTSAHDDATTADHGGFDLAATDDGVAGVLNLEADLERLPALDDIVVSVETTDTGMGLTWTLTSRDPAGDIPTLACTATRRPRLGAQRDRAAQVEVCREGPDAQNGFVWSVTFVSVSGDVPTLEVVSSLTGSGAAVAATTVVDGNALGGTFALQTADGYTTDQLPYDVSTGALEAALEALSGVGAIEVTTGWELDESSEYGKAYMIESSGTRGDGVRTIVGYSIQWDDAVSFADADTDAATCDTTGYGDCLAEGAAISGAPPYDYVVSGLTINTTYYFCIAARNELYDPPRRGGRADVVFDVSASEVDAAALYEDGPSVVYATGLSAGTLYYVRVAAVNTVGTSAWATASNPTAPAAAPDRVTFSSTGPRSRVPFS
ncbi:hypothetical protein JL720_12940 [Aureococcus anophagefferens]|nr:hypothetical protein JL720_12940 [Aureococcus anophagefferens]